MLLTEKVTTKWNGHTRKQYEEKGYIFTKMNKELEVNVEDLLNGSVVKVDVKCDCENCKNPYLKPMRWDCYIRSVNEDGKYYCKKCTATLCIKDKRCQTKLKKGDNSFEKWCLENNRQDVLNRWDYELNELKPIEITYGSKKKYYFKCPKELHKSELKNINSFTNGQDGGMNCKQCNSFAQWGIDNLGENFLDKYWDYSKNILNPWEISYASGIIVFIYCQDENKPYHESYNVHCIDFTINNSRCPFCRGLRVHPLDSLGQYIIDNYEVEFLDKIWSEKNTKSSFTYSLKTPKKVYWRCLDSKHKDYPRGIGTSNNLEFRCPDCTRERDESFLQEQVRLYLESLNNKEYTILHESKCTIVPQHPKHTGSRGQMPFDNEVVELKLVCEVHGCQHYNLNPWHESLAIKNGTTPEYEFHMQKVRDRYKKYIAYKNGYNYVAIPYWTVKNDKFKKLIDNILKII